MRNALFVIGTIAAAGVLVAGARFAAAQTGIPDTNAPRPGDEPALGNAADYEVLRKLLGLPPPAPAEEPVPAVEEEPAPAAAPEALPEAEVAPSPKSPARRVVPETPVVDAPRPPGRDANPARAAKPAARPPVVTKAPAAPVAPQAPPLAAMPPAAAKLSSNDLPPIGAVIRAGNMARWSHLFGPSVQWAMLRGASVRVGKRKSIPMEAARAAATQHYHDQVTLTGDRRDMANYVAGIPFPLVTADDPDAGIKIIFNQQSRIIVDDVDARQMGCEIGTIRPGKGFERERTYLISHWRRLFYVSRLYYQPRPVWQTREGIRYRELQYPLTEPFDLKGGGWNYIRYLDVGRPDDGWIYYPVTRRVRRISTAQRSQGFIGQDMDLDSYTGYAGNPAWMSWRLVGEKTMLASMHSEHNPVHWQAPPADFAADEPWEPREVYVVEGRSLLSEYGFARRVVYVDKESYLIPYSEIYDHQGKLWKALHQTWGFGTKIRPDAGGRELDEFYLPGFVMVDMQIDHATRCELPYSTAVGDKGWYYNYGEREGSGESAFDMAGFLGETR